jgi:hypothetical protein
VAWNVRKSCKRQRSEKTLADKFHTTQRGHSLITVGRA